tara:strand:- start:445 stop:723 length:279 start_codon:yes stop_codon:yes gene_type:complete
MTKDETIKDTLEVIRRALEDDNIQGRSDDILILNRKVNNDGTINIIKKDQTDIDEINKIIDDKINYIFEEKFDEWLDKRLPDILEKNIKNKY